MIFAEKKRYSGSFNYGPSANPSPTPPLPRQSYFIKKNCFNRVSETVCATNVTKGKKVSRPYYAHIIHYGPCYERRRHGDICEYVTNCWVGGGRALVIAPFFAQK